MFTDCSWQATIVSSLTVYVALILRSGIEVGRVGNYFKSSLNYVKKAAVVSTIVMWRARYGRVDNSLTSLSFWLNFVNDVCPCYPIWLKKKKPPFLPVFLWMMFLGVILSDQHNTISLSLSVNNVSTCYTIRQHNTFYFSFSGFSYFWSFQSYFSLLICTNKDVRLFSTVMKSHFQVVRLISSLNRHTSGDQIDL